MRLLNAVSKRLEDFPDELDVPPYAILSHTWGVAEGEVLIQDLQTNDTGSWQSATRKQASWAKVVGTCAQARKDNIDYVWIDTCCIDKSSSAELQEAINSMFRWYENAQVCYAYLADVSPSSSGAVDVYASGSGGFRDSRWFTRGWTLQELLAPLDIVFYDQEWNEIALKRELAAMLEQVTGIRSEFIWRGSLPSEVGIGAFASLSRASIAERMSWMSKRRTTRREDMAYCLLGIFDIHMPMLYGEGTRAFIRLQEELMRIADDMSLFAWGLYRRITAEAQPTILAPSPEYFEHCGSISSLHLADYKRPSFSMSQQGLIAKVLTRVDRNFDNLSYIVLHCGLISSSKQHRLVVVPVVSTRATKFHNEWDDDGHFVRPAWCRPFLVSHSFLDGVSVQTIRVVRSTTGEELLWELPINLQPPPPTAEGSPELSFRQIYPPNRVTNNLVSLRDYPITGLYDESRRLVQFLSAQLVLKPSSNTIPQRARGDEFDSKDGGMVLILTGMPNGDTLLIALCHLNSMIDGDPSFKPNVTCRVFRMSYYLEMEAIYTKIIRDSPPKNLVEIPQASSLRASDVEKPPLKQHIFNIDHNHQGTLSLCIDTTLQTHTESGYNQTIVAVKTTYTKDSPAMSLITKSGATTTVLRHTTSGGPRRL